MREEKCEGAMHKKYFQRAPHGGGRRVWLSKSITVSKQTVMKIMLLLHQGSDIILSVQLACTKWWSSSAPHLLTALISHGCFQEASAVLVPVKPFTFWCFLALNLASSSIICFAIIIINIVSTLSIQGFPKEEFIILYAP